MQPIATYRLGGFSSTGTQRDYDETASDRLRYYDNLLRQQQQQLLLLLPQLQLQ